MQFLGIKTLHTLFLAGIKEKKTGNHFCMRMRIMRIVYNSRHLRLNNFSIERLLGPRFPREKADEYTVRQP